MKLKQTLLFLALAALIYVLLNLSPDRQYALVTAVAAFVIMNVVPVLQTCYAREQTAIARRQEIRDVAREEREDAERDKRPSLAVTLYGTSATEFYPIGGHRDPSASIQFPIYVENTGDARAEDVVVQFGLPRWVHSARYTVEIDSTTGKRHISTRQASPDDLQFEFGSPPGVDGCSEVAMVTLTRPVYPGQPWRLGAVVVSMPTGTHRFSWVIDSHAGRTISDDATALSIAIHETAKWHDDLPWEALQAGTTTCRFCDKIQHMKPSEVFKYIQSLDPREQ